MGFMSRAAKRTVRRTFRAGNRANGRRLRQRGPTHGYGPHGRYRRIDQQPSWGGWPYVALIIALAAGILAVLVMIAMLLRS